MKTAISSLLLFATLGLGTALGGCCARCESDEAHASARAQHEDEDEEAGEQELALAQVPQIVKDAALAAVPGLVLEEAEQESEDGALIYALEGRADGKEYELEVSAAGKVLEIEKGSADSKDEDEDDD